MTGKRQNIFLDINKMTEKRQNILQQASGTPEKPKFNRNHRRQLQFVLGGERVLRANKN